MHLHIANLSKDKLNRKEQLEFLDYLKNSLENGFSLNSSVELMAAMWPEKSQMLIKMNQRLTNGSLFTDEISKLGFSKLVTMQIKLAIGQGNLIECLNQLTILTRLKNEQIKKIALELSYPFILGVLMVILLIFMETFVSSQFSDSHEYTGNILLFILISIVIYAVYYFAKILFLLSRQDYSSLKKLSKFAYIGPVIKIYINYLLVYDIGMLLASGFSLQSMCNYALKQDKNTLQYQLGLSVNAKLKKGKELTEIIKSEEFLPDNLLLLLKTGSKRTSLSKRCLILGQSLFNELTTKIERLVISIQPICFILLGLCVIGMYLKLLLPMYAMMQNI